MSPRKPIMVEILEGTKAELQAEVARLTEERDEAKRAITAAIGLCDSTADWKHIAEVVSAYQSNRVALTERCREYELQLSEIVSPELDGAEWIEELPDGHKIPVMRGSPSLDKFIAKVYAMGLLQQQRAAEAEARCRELERERDECQKDRQANILDRQHFQKRAEAAERERDDYRDLFSNAAFALWGQPKHKTDAAEEFVVEKMKEMGIDWNGDKEPSQLAARPVVDVEAMVEGLSKLLMATLNNRVWKAKAIAILRKHLQQKGGE